jgi:hypothetical protein
MPRVRFLQSVAGDDVGDRHAGDEADLPAAVAQVWADGVRAELVRADPVQRPERGQRREQARRGKGSG